MEIRRGNSGDVDFIIEAILNSEKSGADFVSYCRIFSITEATFIAVLRDILEEEMEGQEWHAGHYFIGEIENEKASCLSAWVEGKIGMSSAILKAQALSYFLKDAWAAASENMAITSKVQIPRLRHAIQLENIYTIPQKRGLGLAGQLIRHAIAELTANDTDIAIAEIQLMANNHAAMRSYTKCGFLTRTETQVSDPQILTLLPGSGKVSLTLPVSHG